MSIKLPESYQAYCSDTAVRAAVDHIFSSEGSKKQLALPPDIEWEELRAFHRAVLSAHQVRCEYGSFLLDLWDAVWQPALGKCDFGMDIMLRSTHDSEEWLGWNLDTYSLWKERSFHRVFDIGPDFVISPGVWVETEDVQLSFSFWGVDDTDHTTGRNFGENWPDDETEDGYAYSSRNLARIKKDDGTIDLNALRKAAANALAAVRTHLQV